jgi:hypothetical protein
LRLDLCQRNSESNESRIVFRVPIFQGSALLQSQRAQRARTFAAGSALVAIGFGQHFVVPWAAVWRAVGELPKLGNPARLNYVADPAAMQE